MEGKLRSGSLYWQKIKKGGYKMKTRKLIVLAGIGLVVLTVLFSVSFSQADGVRGHYRSNGMYVQPYQRTHPDVSPYNNYGFPGNYNPNSGRITPGNPNSYLDNYYSHPKGFNQSPYQYRSR
jgi:hypothetical protein